MAEQSYFMGQDGFIWFVGVVEDRNDPERIGRVRVRCLGFHTEDLNSQYNNVETYIFFCFLFTLIVEI